ncbi:MAG: amidohydrolase [Opitutus sp.]|nr:amidohydrolase [Opitutus sp.]
MCSSKFLSVLVFAGAAVVIRASDNIPAPKQSVPVLLRGATIHTVSGADVRGDLLFADGKIQTIGAKVAAPAGATVLDVTGKHIYPGLIAASSGMGLTEIGAVRSTVDLAETGLINPNVRAQPAINPDSEMIPVARTNGILTVLSVPQTAGLIAGMSTLIRMDGWTWEDLTIRPTVALHVSWPRMAISRAPNSPSPAEDQQRALDARITKLRDTFAAARAYLKAKEGAGKAIDVDARWEAMIPVLRGALPVFVQADEVKQIEAAVAWAKQENLKITIVGGIDAWRVADLLKARDVAVIVTSVTDLPLRREDAFDAAYANSAKLQAAGVRFCIANDGASNERNLPYWAGKAAAYGLPPAEALKAVTLYPAQLLGVGGELGSIEAGKRATLIVTDGDPLEIPTKVEIAFIDGARIDLGNRQTRLYEKYKKRYEQLKK